jgi:hypothetical protein
MATEKPRPKSAWSTSYFLLVSLEDNEMPVPSNPLSVSPAASALNLGSGTLPQQLQDETEEQRRKRLQMQQTRMAMGPASQVLGLGV